MARIRLDRGRVAGVVLASGETLDAPAVVSSADPKRTMLGLLPPGALPLKVEEEFRRLRCRGTAAKVHLALSGPLELAGADGRLDEAIRIGGGHVDDLERAFDAIKYRGFSARPNLEIRVPTVVDPSLAPAGHHVVSILASYAPYDLEGGWSAEARERLGRRRGRRPRTPRSRRRGGASWPARCSPPPISSPASPSPAASSTTASWRSTSSW